MTFARACATLFVILHRFRHSICCNLHRWIAPRTSLMLATAVLSILLFEFRGPASLGAIG